MNNYENSEITKQSIKIDLLTNIIDDISNWGRYGQLDLRISTTYIGDVVKEALEQKLKEEKQKMLQMTKEAFDG